WGTFTFTGISDSFRETLDFFSPEGVPLRSTVALSLKEQPNEFSALERDNPAAAGSPSANAFEVPGAGAGLGVAAGIASLGGDLRAARAIAGMNGEASLPFSAGATLAIGGSVELKAAVSLSGGAAVSASVSAPTLRFDAGRLAAPTAPQQLATDAGAGF